MTHTLSRLSICAALMLAVSAAAPALAQTAAPALAQTAAPAAQQTVKPTDVKLIGDWGIRCFNVNSPSPCEMVEMIAQKGTGKRLMSISIGYAPKADRHIIQIALPLGVSLAKGVKISSDNYNSPALPYRRCDQAGCYVEGFMDNGAVDSLASGGQSAKVMIAAANGKGLTLPFSLRGFAQAHDALKALARQKTAGTTAPAPAK